ncbi:helix-turn-helix domain-containing protein [Variovorax paradoxus]|uniref:helix-turn-helix domain-containing protein n=1 Tax=Variovorax paradoxus TaxID=34073 RepID=UPI0027885C46|nr:XRE family transcriptional regulator [Variovorax paradoxus]MDP9927903.1 transcriptional regulator with XRE-family HTH domain [Variovorax paradoxus]
MEENKADLDETIRTVARRLGERLRDARRSKAITLEVLSAKTDLSAGFLSRLERGETSASISNLIVISESLGIALRDFFEDAQERPRPDYVLTRAKDRSCEAPLSAGGYTYGLTSGDLEGEQVSAFELVYPAGETMHPEVLTHRGEEVLYLLEGTMEFRIGSDTMVLEPGDCVHFACDQPHTGENIGHGEARLLMIVSPVDSIDIPARMSGRDPDSARSLTQFTGGK